MWVRGLKLSIFMTYLVTQESHPMWVRGLKQVYIHRTCTNYSVAPYVGAWIET